MKRRSPTSGQSARAPRFGSIRDACSTGVAGEIENAAMYDRLIDMARRAEVIDVFERLRRDSQDHNLAAFQRCSSGHNDRASPGVGRQSRRTGVRVE